MQETDRVNAEICTHKIIAILRGMPGDKLLHTADALYEGGIRPSLTQTRIVNI